MDGLLLYMLKFSIAIAVLAAFYYLMLKKLTFFHLNRVYFIAVIIIAFLLPAVDLTAFFSEGTFERTNFLQVIPSIGDAPFRSAQPAPGLNIAALIFIVWLMGVFILLCRLIVQYVSLFRIKNQAVLIHHENGMKVYEVEDDLAPFSFGSGIYLPKEKYPDDERQKILAHESVHVRGNHSADIFLSEVLCIANWFNPFAWCLRRYIRQNLEFIADDAVLLAASGKKEYQYLLLKLSTGSPSIPVTTFSAENLKKRIVMMNTTKSSRSHLLRFIAIVPVLFFVSILFRTNNIVAQIVGPVTLQSEGGVEIRSDSSKPKPLFIVDEWRQPAGFDTKFIKPEDISSVSVWKGAEAVKKFGSEGTANGVIAISTKLPLYVIDGVVQMKTSNPGILIKDEDIASMNVLKGEADKGKYLHRSENGIIEITKKKK